jgi:hypothetical protein
MIGIDPTFLKTPWRVENDVGAGPSVTAPERHEDLLVFAAGSCCLVAHVFVLNDWSGMSSDLRDPNRATDVFMARGIGRAEIGYLWVALLAASVLLLSQLGSPTPSQFPHALTPGPTFADAPPAARNRWRDRLVYFTTTNASASWPSTSRTVMTWRPGTSGQSTVELTSPRPTA